MKFTINWLKQYVDFDLSAEELADRLTMLGLEVDAVEALYPGLERIKVARVITVAKHPNADKLSLCDVMVGDEQKRIVCGAPNVRAGMLAPIALPGCTMPSGMQIKKSKIRGELSEGMLCSAAELGIAHESAGLMDLPESCACGDSLTQALALADTMIEVDITPNRADCTSLIGVAREVAGVTGNTLTVPVSAANPLVDNGTFAVEVQAPDACPRYAARLLKQVTIAPSPWWLKRLLLAVGLRPINNVVDITNFVMLEYGQPLHAFDFATLAGGRIIVRKAKADETMTTLDGVERKLDPEMLLICDAERPVAVAGVMGGQNSEVTAQTTDILLESAYFNPLSVRRTSRALNLSTDASYRFERGVDPQGTINALERAAQLMVEVCGAKLMDGGVDCFAALAPPPAISLRVSRASSRLGINFTMDEIAGLLGRIAIPCHPLDHDTLTVHPPSFRVDLEREIDLIEEVARLNGYNAIPVTMPVVPMALSEQDPTRLLRTRLSAIMVAFGVYEAVNYSFTSQRYADLLGLAPDDPLRVQVKILNPLADDQGVMRTMLLPGLLENLKHNVNRQNLDCALFEIGKVFWPLAGQEQPREAMRLSAVFSGRPGVGAPVYHYGQRTVDLFDLKGMVESILTQLGILAPEFEQISDPPLYADADAVLMVRVGERVLGLLGRVAPVTQKRFGIKQAVYFLDLDLDAVAALKPVTPLFRPLSKFPSVSWDLAVVVPETIGAGDIVSAIMAQGLALVSRVEIFDVYRGKPIADGMKSVALSITYHSEEQTLDDNSVGQVQGQVIDLIRSRFDGHLREV